MGGKQDGSRFPPPRVACPKKNISGGFAAPCSPARSSHRDRMVQALFYGTVTGLVFGKLYFPGSSPLIGVLQAFGVFSHRLRMDFARTPGGTRYFLFAPISTDTKAAARFIVVLCFYFAGTLIYSYIGYISRILWGAARNLYSLWIGRHREAQTTSSQEPPAAPPRPTKSWMQRVERSERLVSALSYYVANF